MIHEEFLRHFHRGDHLHVQDVLGARSVHRDGLSGASFLVWAPAARDVAVLGDFNEWRGGATPLRKLDDTGLWEGFVKGLRIGARYKFRVTAQGPGQRFADKADPFALHADVAPRRASRLGELTYTWGDAAWQEARDRTPPPASCSLYRLDAERWLRDERGAALGYRDLAPLLADHVSRLGFSHVELPSLLEHPSDEDGPRRPTGFFAPTSRHGTPDDLMFLIDTLHQAGLGVLMAWTPGRFATDEHGLGYFDGTHLFEHPDPRRGLSPDGSSFLFDHGRPEVRSFLRSSALFWIERYHLDGLCLGDLDELLRLDLGRHPEGWLPDSQGGPHNLDARSFLRALSDDLRTAFPGLVLMASAARWDDSLTWPTYLGGLGLSAQHDTLWSASLPAYLRRSPTARPWAHHLLTERPLQRRASPRLLSLDDPSWLDTLPGPPTRRLATLRALLALQHGSPGHTSLLMGLEQGTATPAPLATADARADTGLALLVADLHRLRAREPALHAAPQPGSLEELDPCSPTDGVVGFLRRAPGSPACVLVVANLSDHAWSRYRMGVPHEGWWRELLNTDAREYGGDGLGNLGGLEADALPAQGQPCSLALTLPPHTVLWLRGDSPPADAPHSSPSVDLELHDTLTQSAWPDTPAGHPRHTSTLLPPPPAAEPDRADG